MKTPAALALAAGVVAGAWCGYRLGQEGRAWLDALDGVGCAPDDAALLEEPEKPAQTWPSAGATALDDPLVAREALKEYLACGCPCHLHKIPGPCQCCAVAKMRGVTVG